MEGGGVTWPMCGEGELGGYLAGPTICGTCLLLYPPPHLPPLLLLPVCLHPSSFSLSVPTPLFSSSSSFASRTSPCLFLVSSPLRFLLLLSDSSLFCAICLSPSVPGACGPPYSIVQTRNGLGFPGLRHALLQVELVEFQLLTIGSRW